MSRWWRPNTERLKTKEERFQILPLKKKSFVLNLPCFVLPPLKERLLNRESLNPKREMSEGRTRRKEINKEKRNNYLITEGRMWDLKIGKLKRHENHLNNIGSEYQRIEYWTCNIGSDNIIVGLLDQFQMWLEKQ